MTGLTHLHNFLRWIVLVLLIWSMVNAFLNKNGKETRFLTISSHVMLLLGLIQWFVGVWGLKLIQNVGMSELMSNESMKAARFFAVEHPLTMIIAIALITVGGVSVKKGKGNAKWFYLVALLLILSRIPWPFMKDNIGRGLFPGMKANQTISDTTTTPGQSQIGENTPLNDTITNGK